MAKEKTKVLSLARQETVRILLKLVIWTFALFGLLFILLLMCLVGLLRTDIGTVGPLPKKMILQIDFDTAPAEIKPDDLTAAFYGGGASFFELMQVLAMAGTDERVEAIVGKIGVSDLSLAQVQELRGQIKYLRTKGKKTYLFSEGFGSFGGGTAEYYLASAFDEIVLQPSGEVGITGIGIEMPFVKGLLNKIGIEPEFYARYEYKNAFVPFTDTDMSPLLRKEFGRLGGDLFDQIVGDIAKDRKIEPQRLRKLIDEAPLDAKQATEEKLVDRLDYQERFMQDLEEKYNAKRTDWQNYLTGLEPVGQGSPVVAMVIIEGEIAEGDSSLPSWEGEPVTSADSFVAQLTEVAALENLKAVVLRINSPGGSYAAADEMRQALKDFKQKTKVPVVVSMSSYAASGGYFVALPADKILAQPATLTASIGVVGGKPVLSGLWNKLGVRWNGVYFGNNAGILSLNKSFTSEERKIFEKSLDNIYRDFTSKVADARHIKPEELDKLARGRVFSGRQAAKNGLIDGIGGYDEALTAAVRAAGMDISQPMRLEVFPRPKTMQEKIAELIGTVPSAVVSKLKAYNRLDKNIFSVLQRLNYDAVMLPFEIQY